MRRKILVVEDDMDLNTTLVKFLNLKDFEAIGVLDGAEAVDRVYESSFDLIILDVKLPNMDGFSVAKSIREFSSVPIVFLTSLDGQKDVEKGFGSGGDDYIKKPFSLSELHLRIEAIHRRLYKNSHIFEIDDDFSFDTKELMLYRDKQEIRLKPKESKLLSTLLQKQDTTVSKEDIFRELYGFEEIPNEESLRVFINKLRGVLGKDRIKTEKFIGYRFVSRKKSIS